MVLFRSFEEVGQPTRFTHHIVVHHDSPFGLNGQRPLVPGCTAAEVALIQNHRAKPLLLQPITRAVCRPVVYRHDARKINFRPV